MIYFTSDTHFGHFNIIDFCDRPIPGVKCMSRDEAKEAMNRLLISNWNSKIANGDEVYFLGDFAFMGTPGILDILKQLRGKKYMIRGNHDYGAFKKKEVEEHFEWIRDYYHLRIHDKYEDGLGDLQQYHQSIILCHFPILSWDGMAHGSWHLHGHCHGSLPPTRSMRMDVGVDTNNLLPYSYEDIKKVMIMRTVVPVDHHGL